MINLVLFFKNVLPGTEPNCNVIKKTTFKKEQLDDR